MKESHGKNKGKNKAKKLKPIQDALDDNNREQVEPCEEPMTDEQDEKWAFPEHDKRTAVSTRGKDDE
jgi:hypothetical protein